MWSNTTVFRYILLSLNSQRPHIAHPHEWAMGCPLFLNSQRPHIACPQGWAMGCPLFWFEEKWPRYISTVYQSYPAATRRNNNVIMTSKRRRNAQRRFDVMMTLLLRRVAAGIWLHIQKVAYLSRISNYIYKKLHTYHAFSMYNNWLLKI